MWLRLLKLFGLSLILVSSSPGESSFDFESINGKWQGTGRIIFPGVEIPFDLDGKATFEHDSINGSIRTSLVAEKFLFTYSDTGRMVFIGKDSVSWEVWDNFGKHALYYGHVEGNTIRGQRVHKTRKYEFEVTQLSPDSLMVQLTKQNEDGEIEPIADFQLQRVK